MNHQHGWDGPVLRGRYTDVLVCESAHWEWLLAYVHLNPERVGSKHRVADPRWTSHAGYLGDHPLRQWLDPSEHLGILGGEQAYARWLTEVSGGNVPAPTSFLPERPASGMAVVPVPRVGNTPQQLLGQVENVVGRAVPTGRSSDPVVAIAAWWCALNGARQVDAAKYLHVDRSTMSRRQDRAIALAKQQPHVAGWMAALSGMDPRDANRLHRGLAA